MTNSMERAYHHAREWIEAMDTDPVHVAATPAELRQRFSGSMPEKGTPSPVVIDELARDARAGILGSAGGRFFAWVMGGGTEAGVAADWLVSTWDQNAALYACSPIAAIIEEIAGEWMKELLDLPREASFAITTGCQIAHMTSLAAARHAVLKRANWDVEQMGLFGAPSVNVLTSNNRHDSIDRAARFLGLGRASIVNVDTDEMGKILPAALGAALSKNDAAKIVVLNAADLNVGSCDPFLELIPMAKEVGAWVHIDGAFGLTARASREKRVYLEGVDLADSWATDAHKWLNVPFDCGLAFIRDTEAHAAAMTETASYLSVQSDARNQIDWNPEWSRRSRAITLYAVLKEFGRDGVEDLVNRCCAHCDAIVHGIGGLPGAEVLASPTLNQGLVRFVKNDADEAANDAFTDDVIGAINKTGEAYFSGTTWRGRRAMRVSVVNWRTTEHDVERAIAAARGVLRELTG